MAEDAGIPVSVPLDENKRQLDGWALAIGRFLVAFTSCEVWTYHYIKTFGSHRLHDAAADMNLGPRGNLAHALVSDIGLVTHVQERVDAAFKKLKELSHPRNLVAHNGPLVHLYQNSNTGELEVRHELRSARDPSKDITIAELEKLHAEAVELDQELALLYGVVRHPESQIVGNAVEK